MWVVFYGWRNQLLFICIMLMTSLYCKQTSMSWTNNSTLQSNDSYPYPSSHPVLHLNDTSQMPIHSITPIWNKLSTFLDNDHYTYLTGSKSTQYYLYVIHRIWEGYVHELIIRNIYMHSLDKRDHRLLVESSLPSTPSRLQRCKDVYEGIISSNYTLDYLHPNEMI